MSIQVLRKYIYRDYLNEIKHNKIEKKVDTQIYFITLQMLMHKWVILTVKLTYTDRKKFTEK